MEQAISSDLIRGHIDTIILHTLIDGDKFAQQISDSIEEKSGNEYKINQATLYSSLKRLENLKHVSSYWYDSVGGRRKYFKLTELGKSAVDSNLSSWAYSRAIIDKLMDCEPEPIIETKYIEKEIIKEKLVEVPVMQSQTTATDALLQPTAQPSNSSSDERVESVQEVNFRNILNGLIKSTTVQKPQNEVLEPLNKQTTLEKKDEKLKFKENITATDYNSHKASNTGKIDFGDLALKAAKEGYKIRISTKDSGIIKGNLLINKLNFSVALIVYLIVMLELLFLTTSLSYVINPGTVEIVVAIVALTIFPISMLIKFLIAPTRKTAKNVSSDSILTASIIVFNLLLITLAANLLANVNFSNLNVIIYSLIIPCVLYFDMLTYYVIRFFLAKSKIFNLKHKKTA